MSSSKRVSRSPILGFSFTVVPTGGLLRSFLRRERRRSKIIEVYKVPNTGIVK